MEHFYKLMTNLCLVYTLFLGASYARVIPSNSTSYFVYTGHEITLGNNIGLSFVMNNSTNTGNVGTTGSQVFSANNGTGYIQQTVTDHSSADSIQQVKSTSSMENSMSYDPEVHTMNDAVYDQLAEAKSQLITMRGIAHNIFTKYYLNYGRAMWFTPLNVSQWMQRASEWAKETAFGLPPVTSSYDPNMQIVMDNLNRTWAKYSAILSLADNEEKTKQCMEQDSSDNYYQAICERSDINAGCPFGARDYNDAFRYYIYCEMIQFKQQISYLFNVFDITETTETVQTVPTTNHDWLKYSLAILYLNMQQVEQNIKDFELLAQQHNTRINMTYA